MYSTAKSSAAADLWIKKVSIHPSPTPTAVPPLVGDGGCNAARSADTWRYRDGGITRQGRGEGRSHKQRRPPGEWVSGGLLYAEPHQI